MASLRSNRNAPERRLEPDGIMRNGIDLGVLNGAVDQIREEPATAAIKIRTRHLWNEGYAVDGFAEEVEGADGVTKRSFKFRTDWPEEIGGDDSGPSPGEALLGALGGCVAMTYISKAAARGVDIEALEVTIEAEVDLRGSLKSISSGQPCRRPPLRWLWGPMSMMRPSLSSPKPPGGRRRYTTPWQIPCLCSCSCGGFR